DGQTTLNGVGTVTEGHFQQEINVNCVRQRCGIFVNQIIQLIRAAGDHVPDDQGRGSGEVDAAIEAQGAERVAHEAPAGMQYRKGDADWS
ncbi:hypothetical protein THAOC_35080, partial [Thalassiosira oceanica]